MNAAIGHATSQAMTQWDGSLLEGGVPTPAFAKFALSARTRGRHAIAQTIKPITQALVTPPITSPPKSPSGSFRETNQTTMVPVTIRSGPMIPR